MPRHLQRQGSVRDVADMYGNTSSGSGVSTGWQSSLDRFGAPLRLYGGLHTNARYEALTHQRTEYVKQLNQNMFKRSQFSGAANGAKQWAVSQAEDPLLRVYQRRNQANLMRGMELSYSRMINRHPNTFSKQLPLNQG